MSLYLHFERATQPSVIGWVTWGRWKHVWVQVGDQHFESAFGVGVRRLPVVRESDATLELPGLSANSVAFALSRAESLIGTPYDWRGALHFATHGDSPPWVPGSLHCSAFACHIVEAAKSPPFARTDYCKVSPEMLYCCPLFP